jgi:DNA-binding LacI/PurR family transcriptional regulator
MNSGFQHVSITFPSRFHRVSSTNMESDLHSSVLRYRISAIMANLKDIANALGINVSTVSRALNNSSEISESKKELVRQKARELHYMPNLAARTLTGKSSKSIGLIIPEVKSDYYAQITNYIETYMKFLGYSVIIGITNFLHELELDCLNSISSRKVDGIIFTSGTEKNIKKVLDRMHLDYRIPVVLLDPLWPINGYDTLRIDNLTGITEAIQFLVDSGRKRIAYIGDSISSIGRLPSFRKAMEAKGGTLREELILVGPERFEKGGYQSMKELLQSGVPLPDAIFASYDDMAIGILKALYEAGIEVPTDIAVVGYDDIRYAEYLRQPLTTISCPLEEFCKQSVRFLIERIPDNDIGARQVLFPTKLILRETT